MTGVDGRLPLSRHGGADLVPTPSQTIGPFLSMGLQPLERPEIVPPGTPGSVSVHGQILDGAQVPVPDAVVEVWQPDPDGRFGTVPDGGSWFGRSLADADGRYRIRTVKPGSVTLQSGTLQAPHLEMLVFARGLLRPVRTRVYFGDEAEANTRDPVLGAIADAGRRGSLVAAGDEDGYRFDVHLQGPDETVFFAL